MSESESADCPICADADCAAFYHCAWCGSRLSRDEILIGCDLCADCRDGKT